ncbi:MAG: thioredoxin [Pseudomonadota bacterium]
MDRAFFSSDSANYLFLMLLAGLLVGVSSTAWSVEFYRCTLNGRVEFRQTPCTAGEQEKTQVVEQSSGMTPVEPALRLAPAKAKRQKSKPVRETKRKPNEERCWKIEKRLERVEQRLRGGYKASQYGKLHRTQDEYEDYLKRFCQ